MIRKLCGHVQDIGRTCAGYWRTCELFFSKEDHRVPIFLRAGTRGGRRLFFKSPQTIIFRGFEKNRFSFWEPGSLMPLPLSLHTTSYHDTRRVPNSPWSQLKGRVQYWTPKNIFLHKNVFCTKWAGGFLIERIIKSIAPACFLGLCEWFLFLDLLKKMQ